MLFLWLMGVPVAAAALAIFATRLIRWVQDGFVVKVARLTPHTPPRKVKPLDFSVR